MPEAEEQPKSILFPAGVPGPYFPSDDEIASAAQKQLENNSDTPLGIIENNNGSLEEIVDIVELDDGDNSAYGTMSQNSGGLAKTIWQPSTYDKIEMLLKALNLPSKSPAMDEISQKLLLTFATAPTGEAIETSIRNDETGDSFELVSREFDAQLLKRFINLRLAELIERGNLTDLAGFIQNLPDGTLAPDQKNAEILMLGGDLIGACQMSQTARSLTEQRNRNANLFATINDPQQQASSTNNVFWLRMLGFCRVLEENNAGAQIALDMLNEQGSMDFVFSDLLNKLMEDPMSRATFFNSGSSSLDPLNYTILSLLDQPIGDGLIETGSPLIVSALVINPNMSAQNRFQAAVKSNVSGGISAEVLRNIFDLQEFTMMEYNNAARLAQFDDRPMADALLYQAASKKSNDIEKAEILEIIWQRAQNNNDMPRKAVLNIETLKALNPTLSLINHSHHIARGLILGGEIERAIQWYNLARRSASSGDGEATRALINIWPLVVLASDRGDIPWSEDILNLWWNGQMVLAPQNRDDKAALFYAVAEAFQYEVSEKKWADLITDNHPENVQSIPLAVWRELIKSVGENKPAQSIILSLIAMGQEGPGSLDASGISTVIRTLRSFGLESEARKIAIEALVANNF